MPPRRNAAPVGDSTRVDGVDAPLPTGRAAAAAAPHVERPEPRVPLSPDEVVASMPYKVIAQFKTPKDIRISVKGEYWERLPELRNTRLIGTIVQWSTEH